MALKSFGVVSGAEQDDGLPSAGDAAATNALSNAADADCLNIILDCKRRVCAFPFIQEGGMAFVLQPYDADPP